MELLTHSYGLLCVRHIACDCEECCIYSANMMLCDFDGGAEEWCVRKLDSYRLEPSVQAAWRSTCLRLPVVTPVTE